MFAAPPPSEQQMFAAAPPTLEERQMFAVAPAHLSAAATAIRSNASLPLNNGGSNTSFLPIEYNLTFDNLKIGKKYRFVSRDFLTITQDGVPSDSGSGTLQNKSGKRWGGGMASFMNDDSSMFEVTLQYPGIDFYPPSGRLEDYKEITGKNKYEELTDIPCFALEPMSGGRRSSRRCRRSSRRRSSRRRSSRRRSSRRNNRR